MSAIDLILAGAVFLCASPNVHDGDTWRCADGVRVRTWGVDSPELNTPAGPPARNAAARLINGQTLTCTRKGKSYDRIVALCRLPDGRDVAEELLKQRQAVELLRFSGGFYQGVGR
jgi:endonuclease YncB( thermonuclease family)